MYSALLWASSLHPGFHGGAYPGDQLLEGCQQGSLNRPSLWAGHPETVGVG